jgi:hypothetical protein
MSLSVLVVDEQTKVSGFVRSRNAFTTKKGPDQQGLLINATTMVKNSA